MADRSRDQIRYAQQGPRMNDQQQDVASPPVTPRLFPGRYAIVAILIVAVSAAAANLWYQRYLLRKPLELWGQTAILLLARAPHAEVWRLEPAATGREESGAAPPGWPDLERADEWVDDFPLEGVVLHVADRRTASRARGFTHVRRALCQSTTFNWKMPAAESPQSARYALVVSDARDRAVLVFTEGAKQVWLASHGTPVLLHPAACDGVWAFLSEQFLQPAEGHDASEPQTDAARPGAAAQPMGALAEPPRESEASLP